MGHHGERGRSDWEDIKEVPEAYVSHLGPETCVGVILSRVIVHRPLSNCGFTQKEMGFLGTFALFLPCRTHTHYTFPLCLGPNVTKVVVSPSVFLIVSLFTLTVSSMHPTQRPRTSFPSPFRRNPSHHKLESEFPTYP